MSRSISRIRSCAPRATGPIPYRVLFLLLAIASLLLRFASS
jgi:hypothetical protein